MLRFPCIQIAELRGHRKCAWGRARTPVILLSPQPHWHSPSLHRKSYLPSFLIFLIRFSFNDFLFPFSIRERSQTVSLRVSPVVAWDDQNVVKLPFVNQFLTKRESN